jgi:hypothetical protein
LGVPVHVIAKEKVCFLDFAPLLYRDWRPGCTVVSICAFCDEIVCYFLLMVPFFERFTVQPNRVHNFLTGMRGLCVVSKSLTTWNCCRRQYESWLLFISDVVL